MKSYQWMFVLCLTLFGCDDWTVRNDACKYQTIDFDSQGIPWFCSKLETETNEEIVTQWVHTCTKGFPTFCGKDNNNEDYVISCENDSITAEHCQLGCYDNKCADCEPDETQCTDDNKSIQTCVEHHWDAGTNCAYGCNDGICYSNCMTGHKRCNGNNLEVCNNDEWSVETTCTGSCKKHGENGAVCENMCKKDEQQCLPGNQSFQKCNNDFVWEVFECKNNEKCVNGACVTKNCIEDDLKCGDNNNPLKCVNENWEPNIYNDDLKAAEGRCEFSCFNGVCVSCKDLGNCAYIIPNVTEIYLYSNKSTDFNIQYYQEDKSIPAKTLEVEVNSSHTSCFQTQKNITTGNDTAYITVTAQNPTEDCTGDIIIRDPERKDVYSIVTVHVKVTKDENFNHIYDDLEFSDKLGDDCQIDEDCNSERYDNGFCDSFLGYRCSTRCTSDDDCIESDYFCRSDGRCTPKTFTTVWKTTKKNEILTFPMASANVCHFLIDWGDEQQQDFDSCPGKDIEHTYSKAGEHSISITGTLDNWAMTTEIPSKSEDSQLLKAKAEKLIKVTSFGPVGLGNYAFAMANNLDSLSVLDIPNSQKLTSLDNFFNTNSNFNFNIEGWDVSHVTSMNGVFISASKFNLPLGKWNTSNVTDMRYMFNGAKAFNQDISKWNISNVTNISYMFKEATVFNQDISKWDTSKVTQMLHVFYNASNFNQDISKWNTSNVTLMSYMFYGAKKFNQNLTDWNTQNVTKMNFMFYSAESFNNHGGTALNWDTSNVTEMNATFKLAKVFNQDISNWNTGKVTKMNSMFESAPKFNQNLNWNTEKVTDMTTMFKSASTFNQDLSSWKINSIKSSEKLKLIFSGTKMSKDNYCKLKAQEGWKKYLTNPGVNYKCN